MSRASVLESIQGRNGKGASPSLDQGPDIGAALKAIREYRGLSLEAIAEATRVRPVYLTAIEEMRLDDLPSRPFVIGYLRAYARALQLDDEAAIARFRAENGGDAEPLREPVGVQHQRDPRLAAAAVAGVVIIAAIGLWNFARHAMMKDAPPQAVAAQAPAPLAAAAGPSQVSLGEPLPAPMESTTPEPYVTPGMADATSADPAAAMAAAKARAAAGEVVVHGPPPKPIFEPRGTIYGTASAGPALVLQARHAGSLVVSTDDGRVVFARQLAGGEAYRAPTQYGLSADVSDPAAFAVYVDGVLADAALPAKKTALSKLIPAAAQ